MKTTFLKYVPVFMLLLPLSVSAQVYKCASQGDTYFSQIPCEDEAEVVVFSNEPMFSESDGAADSGFAAENTTDQPDDNNAELDQGSDMMNFVATLQRQRDQEIDDLDRSIRQMELSMQSVQTLPEDDPQRAALNESLAELNSNRSSVIEQYGSMIAEAQRRVGELSAGDS